MSWVKLDDKFHSHRKIVNASLAAVGLFARSLSYAAAYETDGHIGEGIPAHLGDGNGTLTQELTRLGLWECNGSGFVIHDYLHYNPTAKKLKRLRKVQASRVRAYRKRNALQNKCNGEVTQPRGRDGTGSSESSSDLLLLPDPDARDTFESVWKRYPNKRGKPKAREEWRRVKPPVGLIHRALDWQLRDPEWLRDGGQYVPRLSSYLHQGRWLDEQSAAPVVNDVTAHNLAAMERALK